MQKLTLAAALSALSIASPALAQEAQTEGRNGNMTDLSILPQGCRDAIDQSGMSGMMEGMDMSSMMEGMGEMDEAQKAYMQAMMEMHAPMMAAHTIKDPDLAFHCGMIAHHTGAIGMSEVELQHGDDEQGKAMAQEIIDAQRQENEEMTAWVEEHAGQE